jgi:hypothetical protein
MCNAFGHLLSCKCGWGGTGEVGYTSNYPPIQEARLREFATSCYTRDAGSITKPNYRCKWCGEQVFYFQSKDGGKVLFESLGKPWPIHNCLGIKYERKKSALKIAATEWVQIINLSVTPSSSDGDSYVSGLISDFEGETQYEVKIFLKMNDPILMRDLYINRLDYQKESSDIEVLVIFEDGRHQCVTSSLVERRVFLLESLSNTAPYKTQPKLL